MQKSIQMYRAVLKGMENNTITRPKRPQSACENRQTKKEEREKNIKGNKLTIPYPTKNTIQSRNYEIGREFAWRNSSSDSPTKYKTKNIKRYTGGPSPIPNQKTIKILNPKATLLIQNAMKSWSARSKLKKIQKESEKGVIREHFMGGNYSIDINRKISMDIDRRKSLTPNKPPLPRCFIKGKSRISIETETLDLQRPSSAYSQRSQVTLRSISPPTPSTPSKTLNPSSVYKFQKYGIKYIYIYIYLEYPKISYQKQIIDTISKHLRKQIARGQTYPYIIQNPRRIQN